jgi:hypothetical protein
MSKLQQATEEGASAAEAVEGAALALERIDDVHDDDGLAAGVLDVGDSVADGIHGSRASFAVAAACVRREEQRTSG